MSQPYVMAYYIPLFMLWLYALWTKDKDYTLITNISVIAFVVTRIITFLPEGDQRIMFDFVNDLAVCAILIYFHKKGNLKNNRIVPYLILTYTAMMSGYLLYIIDVVTNSGKTYILEVISVVQLLLILAGMIHGARIKSNYKRNVNSGSNINAVGRMGVSERNQERMATKEADVPFKSGDHAPMAEDS